VDESARFLFIPDGQIQYDPQAVDKILKKNEGQGGRVLREIRPVLEAVGSWTAGEIEAAISAFCERTQLGLSKVAQPIRVAISGTTVSPPIFQSLEFLGKSRTLGRIDRCLGAVA
jgi:glutamyl/glutaminyl-tRNA synthetase